MKPPLLIVNPACGARGAARALPQVLTAVEQTLGDVVIRHTARRGHARELARLGAKEGHPLIVAVGGDGTFSEIVNGVLMAGDRAESVAAGVEAAAGSSATGCSTRQDVGASGLGTDRPETDGAVAVPDAAGFVIRAPRPAVGLINLGTGGDFRRSLGIGPGYEHCLEALALGRERAVDIGRVSFVGRNGNKIEQYFVNVLSAGLGGLVDRYIETVPSFLGGRVGYYLASLRAVVASKEQPLLARITWEGETREEVIPAYLVAICNGRWFGGGMDVAPMALPDNGRFEVVTITAHTKPYLARRVRGVYAGHHLEEPTVHHFPCTRIELRLESETAERRFLLDVDGDALGSLPLTVEMVPRGLRVRA
jgi:diacylglycerol kinase (ATP)